MKHNSYKTKLFILFTIQTQMLAVYGITFDKVLQPSATLHRSAPKVIDTNDTETSATGIREKRQDGQGTPHSRSFIDYAVGPDALGSVPLCFEREVYGTCRYRTSPDECFRHEWTAYATIVNNGYKRITSIPAGLIVDPFDHARARGSPCIVDVRELQDLHPGEIAGIVIGAILFFIIVIAIVAFCVRRQRMKKLEKETVIFGRSLTRSKSRSESINRATSKT